MKDQTALAYVNLYAIFGAIPLLCELDEEARALIADKRISLGFAVRGGPAATLWFDHGKCRLEDGADRAAIRLPFSSPEKFNGMIDGTVTPLPARGFLHLSFLTKTFTALTDILTRYLRADEKALSGPVFLEKSTTLLLHVIAAAVAALCNHDPVSRASASYIVDGEIELSIAGGPSVSLYAKDHLLRVGESSGRPLSYMRFADIATAHALFDGALNAVVAVGTGAVRVGGMISMVDNVNRVMDRVAQYLA